MKKIIPSSLLLICSSAYAQSSSHICVQGLYHHFENNKPIHTYSRIKNDQDVYSCNQSYQDCQLTRPKTTPKEPYDYEIHHALNLHNSVQSLKELGFHFDKYEFASKYAHSLWQPISTAQELNYPLTFKNNLLVFNFPKDKQYQIGAYPRGMWQPIEFMFINNKLTKAVIRKYQGRIIRATFTTDKNERFQYRLSYNGDKLVKSQVLFQKSPKSVWQLANYETYKYTQCPTS